MGFITHSPVIHKVQFMNRFYLHKNNSTLTGFFSECAKNLERLKIKKIGIKIGNDEELSMELLQLEYFYAVAKTQHVTHTAEQLHIAQPALTQSIHRLEKELGVPLFHRNGRNIALTEYGVYLRDALKPILENAIYYGVEGMDGEGEIHVKGYRKEDDIYIEVSDNGLGMPQDMVEQLLTDNNRVRKHGSGVGVINVHNRIRLRFGKPYGLEIESMPDEGTTIRIHLPYIPYEPEKLELLENGKMQDLKGGKSNEEK